MIMPPLTDSNPYFLNSRLLLAALLLNYKEKKTAVDKCSSWYYKHKVNISKYVLCTYNLN